MSYNMAFSEEMNQKAKDAAIKFLRRKEYEILERDCKFDVVAQDKNGSIVFIDIFLQDTLKESPLSRTRIETDMVRELVNHIEWTDYPVRYDTIIVLTLGDRALLKHHLNAISTPTCEDD